ncbi:MAG: holo-ACP synthase, partial [Gemmatimonadaceae bacterium]
MVIGIGIDLVDVARVTRMLERDAERYAARLLTDGEWAYCSGMQRPATHVAVRLAAKEAAFKALAGTEDARAIGWREIEVVHGPHRAPELRLHGRAAARLEELGGSRVFVSLTHSESSA